MCVCVLRIYAEWHGAHSVHAVTSRRNRAISGTKEFSRAWNLRNRNQRPRPPNVLCDFDDGVRTAECLSNAVAVPVVSVVEVVKPVKDDAHFAKQFRFWQMIERADPGSLQRQKREPARIVFIRPTQPRQNRHSPS